MIVHRISTVLNICLLLLVPHFCLASSIRRPITEEDCVRTRRIVEGVVKMPPHGTTVAYVAKEPDLASNRNHDRLYVRDLRKTSRRTNGRLLLDADKLSDIRWLDSGQIAVRVERRTRPHSASRTEVDIVDPATGSFKKMGFPSQMIDYSISASGELVVFSTVSDLQRESAGTQRTEQRRQDHGFRIAFGAGLGSGIDQLRRYNLFLGRRGKGGSLDVRRLTLLGPGNAPRRSSLAWLERLDLSPNGKYLLLNYSEDSLPGGWKEEPLIQQLKGFGTSAETHVLGIYELATGQLRVAFNYPGVFLVEAKWSSDSRAFSVVSPAPFGTPDAVQQAHDAEAFGSIYRYMYRFKNVFVVDPETLGVQKVFARTVGEQEGSEFRDDGPLYWTGQTMILKAGPHSLASFTLRNGAWQESGRFDVDGSGRYSSSMTSDGKVLVAVSQAPMVPPDLVMWRLQGKGPSVLTDLNPEYRSLELGQVESLEWRNRYGSRCAGLLIKPVGYTPGIRYPMVFLAAPATHDFISDSRYTTAYAPQPLANAGFVVVMAEDPLDNKIPPGQFPGEMNDAYNWMAMVESAVDLLSNQGIIDKSKVGIGGFSRTSWLAGFTITHSQYTFSAASLADSAINTYAQYFKYNSFRAMRGEETQIGGPPYGRTFHYWLDYANPFNADRVHCAVLMEFTPPVEDAYEFFVALARQGKPVELYYYPDGAHPLDTPRERVASLQRNVDWFRFWIQGYERHDGTDLEQYQRWRLMRSRSYSEREGNLPELSRAPVQEGIDRVTPSP